MPDSYPIIQVDPEWVLEDEDMGTKEKFWYRKPGDGENKWLFKHPRSNTGEHWAEKRVGWYSAKGRGGIYWGQDVQRNPNPVDLVRRAVEAHASYFGATLEPVEELRDSLLTEIVVRVPRDWMSPLERAFAIKLMACNRDRLLELTR